MFTTALQNCQVPEMKRLCQTWEQLIIHQYTVDDGESDAERMLG